MTHQRTAAVIGGGVGGLTAAALLKRSGWSVDVYERSDALPSAGSALGMWPDAMAILDRIGVADAIRAAGHPQESAEIRNHEGRLLARIPSPHGETVMVSRVALLHALDAVTEVQYGQEVADPTSLHHDVVIAADGITSTARRFVTGRDIASRDLGVTVVIAQFPGETGMFTEYWGPGASFGITPLSRTRCDWHAAFRTPAVETRSPLDQVVDRYRGFTAPVRDALAATAPETVMRYHIRTMPRFRRIHRDNVVLIGDAVHAMAPNLGRGACESMLDAEALVDALNEARDLDAAFARYASTRRAKAQRIALASRLMCRAGMLDSAAGLRDLAMRPMR